MIMLRVITVLVFLIFMPIASGAQSTQPDTSSLESNTILAKEFIAAWSPVIDSLLPAEIPTFVGLMLKLGVSHHCSMVLAVFETYLDIKRSDANASPSLLEGITHLIDEGMFLRVGAPGECARMGLKKLANTDMSEPKVFAVLLDYYALYEEVQIYCRNPTAHNFPEKMQDFHIRSEQFSSRLEILSDQ